jgi:hypothetical protein
MVDNTISQLDSGWSEARGVLWLLSLVRAKPTAFGRATLTG